MVKKKGKSKNEGKYGHQVGRPKGSGNGVKKSPTTKSQSTKGKAIVSGKKLKHMDSTDKLIHSINSKDNKMVTAKHTITVTGSQISNIGGKGFNKKQADKVHAHLDRLEKQAYKGNIDALFEHQKLKNFIITRQGFSG